MVTRCVYKKRMCARELCLCSWVSTHCFEYGHIPSPKSSSSPSSALLNRTCSSGWTSLTDSIIPNGSLGLRVGLLGLACNTELSQAFDSLFADPTSVGALSMEVIVSRMLAFSTISALSYLSMLGRCERER